MTWTVRYSRVADRAISALDPAVRVRVLAAIRDLAADPFRAANVKALHGGGFRLRVGDWRVLYDLRNAELAVVVIRVAHRREAYR